MDIEKPSTHTHRERKEKIIEDLSERVLVVQEILAEIETLFEVSPEEAVNKLTESKDAFSASIPEQISDIINLSDRLKKERALLQKQSEALDSESEDDDVVSLQIEEALNDIDNQLTTLDVDGQTAFYQSILTGYVNIEKRLGAKVSSNGQADKRSYESIGYIENDFASVEQDGLSTVHVVKNESWNGDARVRGQFQPKTLNIYIKESTAEIPSVYDGTLRHERKHLVLDGINRYEISDPASLVASRIKFWNVFVDKDMPDFLDSRIREYFTRDRAKYILDTLHNEFLAEYTRALKSFFGEIGFATKAETMSMALADEDDSAMLNAEFNRSARSLSTAGSQLNQTVAQFDDFQNKLVEKGYLEQAEIIGKFTKHLKTRFVEIIKSLRTSAAHAYSQEGNEALDEMEALVHILPPSKYEHILTYLDARYDKVTVAEDDDWEAKYRIEPSGATS